jgi:hypothetical protein
MCYSEVDVNESFPLPNHLRYIFCIFSYKSSETYNKVSCHEKQLLLLLNTIKKNSSSLHDAIYTFLKSKTCYDFD